jgi:hypothetical protein
MRELDDTALERRLREVLEEHLGALPRALTVETLDRRRKARGVPGRFGRGRGMTLLAAAAMVALVGGALATGSGVLRLRSNVPPAPSLGPLAIASPDATTPRPSATNAPAPSATAAPILWSAARLKQDWPAPVRQEPAGGASVTPTTVAYFDPSGDTGSDATPYVDILEADGGSDALEFRLMSKAPVVDPSQTWIAYGVVVDTNGDGVPDWRYGIDNLPGGDHRAWRTDLHTDRTDVNLGPLPNYGGTHADFLDQVGSAHFGSGYPAGDGSNTARFLFYVTGDLTGGRSFKMGAKLNKPFYVWASVIQDGRVVATDYAPDAGWLVQEP